MTVEEIKEIAPKSELYKIEKGSYVMFADPVHISANVSTNLRDWIEKVTGSKIALVLVEPGSIKLIKVTGERSE